MVSKAARTGLTFKPKFEKEVYTHLLKFPVSHSSIGIRVGNDIWRAVGSKGEVSGRCQ